MIDFHSHVLPGIDDGSKDTQESIQMLLMLANQGVDTVVATPHFSANNCSVAEFINRRQKSYNELVPLLTDDMPKILQGAEVSYYEGISRLAELRKLCAGNSRLLLIEMPMSKWSESSLSEICNIPNKLGVTVVLAHIDRYIAFQSASVWSRLLDAGILMQVNASFFNNAFTRRKAFSMLHRGYVHFLGSDCHSVSHRPPTLSETYRLINKRMGRDFLQDFTEYQRELLSLCDSDNQ